MELRIGEENFSFSSTSACRQNIHTRIVSIALDFDGFMTHAYSLLFLARVPFVIV
jgi:hypothetical protein